MSVALPDSNRSLSGLFLNRSGLSLWVQRRLFRYLLGDAGVPRSVAVDDARMDGVAGKLVTPPDCTGQRTILYLHGGGFALGDSTSHLPYLSRLCLATGANGLLVDYRLAPRQPFPAALHDAVAALRWLQDNHVDPERIVIAGDGSGAGLALSTMLRQRDDGGLMPAAALLISPWVDLVNSDRLLRVQDQGFRRGWASIRMSYYAEMYLGGLDPAHPAISPLFADLSGLPPMLIQSGEREVLAEDARRLAEQASNCRVDNSVEQYAGSRHSLALFAGRHPDADRLLEHGARFLTARMGYQASYQE